MNRRWFDIFSMFSILFIIASFVLYYGKFVNEGLSFKFFMAAFVLFIVRTILRMYFYIKDRKK